MIEYKLQYYKEKINKDRIKLEKTKESIHKLGDLDPNSIDKLGVSNKDKLMKTEIKKIEIEGDISKSTTIINGLNNLNKGLICTYNIGSITKNKDSIKKFNNFWY